MDFCETNQNVWDLVNKLDALFLKVKTFMLSLKQDQLYISEITLTSYLIVFPHGIVLRRKISN